MGSLVLIDADIVAYRCAASCKPEDPVEVCQTRIASLIREIVTQVGATEYRSFLSGPRNWRKDLYPLYKANRKQEPPKWLQQAKEYLIVQFDAEMSDGLEADDEIGIAKASNPEAVIASIDKDFRQFSGRIYDFVKAESFFIDPVSATQFFYQQLLLGDKTDNVPGFDGKPRQRPTKQIEYWWGVLEETPDERDMYELVYDAYDQGGGDFELTSQLLYIWRKNPDHWRPGFEQEV